MATLKRELLISGYFRDHKIESLVDGIIPKEIPLLICLFYPMFIDFNGNTSDLSMKEKEIVTMWLEEVLLDNSTKTSHILTSSLLYDANKHGYTAKAYHEKCDHEKNKLMVIETEYDHIFGCFLSVATITNKIPTMKYYADPNSFLCLIRSTFKHQEPKIYKLKNTMGTEAYFYGDAYGPVFGACEVVLLLHDENTRDAFYLNHMTATFTGVYGNILCGGKSLMTKNLQYEFKVKNMQIFRINIE